MNTPIWQKYQAPIALFSLLISCFVLLLSFSRENKQTKGDVYDLPQVVRPPKIKSSLSFAGEAIHMNIDIKERMERDLITNSYFHTSTVMAIKNAPRYFPMIETILAEKGIPDDFKYLCVAESNLTNATSPANAKGFWQFLKGTALDYGLEVNTEVEERFNVEKSTRAACSYLKTLYNQTGSWVNAAAAYNIGIGNFQKTALSQGEKNYFDMNLNEETSRYVFRIMAIKEILSNPEAFGYYVDEDQRYTPLENYREEIVSQTILNLGEFARQNRISYRLLKYYNPWLIDNKLTVTGGKSYKIKIPN
ncbi:MAG: hypothetical protein RLZZ546_3038 [Bacteroidota bacterium]|jgi:hypothetical protein